MEQKSNLFHDAGMSSMTEEKMERISNLQSREEYLKSAEPDKIYLLLLAQFNNDDFVDGVFKFIKGRYTTMKFMYELVCGQDYESLDFDIDNSYVLTNGVKLEERVSFARFFKMCQEKYPEFDDVDIEDFMYEYEEDEIDNDGIQATGNGVPPILG